MAKTRIVKIGVISDTHLEKTSNELSKIIDGYFSDTKMVLHAGDIVGRDVLNAFSDRDLRAVSGNMDSGEIQQMLPTKQVIQVDRFRIGLIHGWGMHVDMEKEIRKEFGDIDCIVYGHTHSPASHVRDGILFFNPGAPTDRWHRRGGSIGILELSDTIKGRIISV